MKIKVLGCSNSWTSRWTSCYQVNENILMDCGCDAYKAYLQTGKSLTDIKLFLITHFHADHIYGLNVFLTFVHRNRTNKTYKPTIVGPKGIQKMCERVFYTSNLIKFDFSDYVNFVEVKDGDSFEFDGIKISAHKLNHGDVVDFGYILNENEKSIGYTGDTTLVPALFKFIEKCDTCIMNISRTKTNAKHLGVDAFEMLKTKYPNKKLLATHCDEEVYMLPEIKPSRVEEGMIIE
ncbi:MAG: ribonuclease Z [Clostridiales bacterium]|nr:ribonuclease Z [Clostridiales bacterium]